MVSRYRVGQGPSLACAEPDFFWRRQRSLHAGTPPFPKATKTYSLADMTRSGHLDMVLSNDEPEAKLVLLNDGKGNLFVGGTYGDPKGSTRNAAVASLHGF
jgi:hypothetical protein